VNEETGYKYTKSDVCATIAAIIVMVIGFLISNFIAESIPDAPPNWPGVWGPTPILVYMPAIMTSIPLMFCIYMIATANRRARTKSESPTVYRYRDETIVYTGDYELHSEPDSKVPEKVYLIPAECSSCNAPINADVVDWVGPLKAKCPQCGAIIEAKEKIY